MVSLHDVLSQHGSLLLLDAAGATVHVGWLRSGQPPRWLAETEEAGTALFGLVRQLGAANTEAGAFVFCEGPGSNLGIRTAAMAIRTWQALRARRAFSYRSLELLATVRGRPDLTFIADARKQTWYTVRGGGPNGPLEPMARVAPEALQEPLATPAGFRQWSPLPPVAVTSIDYDVSTLWDEAASRPLLRECPEPDAYMSEEPRYATWTPRIHQNPASPPSS